MNEFKPKYRKREFVKLDLQNQNAFGKPVVGSFSMSVINSDKVITKEEAETTIFSDLLLTSDLRGNIKRPNYYFTNSSLAKEAELDNLMLTPRLDKICLEKY